MCKLKHLSQIVHKSCSIYMRTQELAASRLHAWKSAKTRIYTHLIVSTRKCSRVTDPSRSQHISTDHAVFLVQHRPRSTRLGNMTRCVLLRFVTMSYDLMRWSRGSRGNRVNREELFGIQKFFHDQPDCQD